MMKIALSLIFSLMMTWPQAMAFLPGQAAPSPSASCQHCDCGGNSCCVTNNPVESQPTPMLPARAPFSSDLQIVLPMPAPALGIALPDQALSLPSFSHLSIAATAPLFKRFCVYLI